MHNRRDFLRSAALMSAAALDRFNAQAQQPGVDGERRIYHETHPAPGSPEKQAMLAQIASELAGENFRGILSQMLVGGETIDDAQNLITPPRKGNNNKLIGASVDWFENQRDFDKAIGYETHLQGLFVHIGNSPRLPVESFIPGKVPFVFLEFMDYNKDPVNQPEFNYRAILSGKHDGVIDNIIRQAETYNEPIIFAPFNEMNGNWNPWGLTVNGNTADLHKQAWHYIKSRFDRSGNPKVKFAWVVNARSVPDSDENRVALAYPDENAVDIVGGDGFNFRNPDMTPKELFDPMLAELNQFAANKPKYIASTGTDDQPNKAAWLKELMVDLIDSNPDIKALLYFHINTGGKHWQFTNDANSVNAVKNALLTSGNYDPRRVIGPNRN